MGWVMNMQKLYEKSRIGFALVWIAVYVIGISITEEVSRTIGVEKLLTLPCLMLMIFVSLRWMRAQNLLQDFGLCRPVAPARRFLYYIPLVVLSSGNLWFGVNAGIAMSQWILPVLTMLCVGFLEEVIFRGFLFNAMRAGGLRSAVIVSSLTFGIGHIVNLFNGSGMEFISNICQMVSAIAFGFLFVLLFLKSGSLIPCIAAHSAINMLSVFAKQPPNEVLLSALLAAGALLYSFILIRTK